MDRLTLKNQINAWVHAVMRISTVVSKALLVLASLFLAARLFGGKSPTDAMRLLGLALAVQTGIDGLEKSSRWIEKLWLALETRFAGQASRMFWVFFVYFALTHSINGLGIHAYQGFDIGFFVQATHNAFSERGLMFKNIDGSGSFFAHHFSPFLFLLSPLGALKEAPFFLYLVQDAALALTFALLYKRVSNLQQGSATLKLMLFALVLGQPFWLGLVYYEFHELSFAPLLMFFLLEGWERKKALNVLIAGLMLLTIKETIFFSMAWFGCYLALFESKKTLRMVGLALSIAATTFWIVYFRLILPEVAHSTESMFIKYYGHLGNSMAEVALSPVLQPMAFLKAIFNSSNALYIFLMFGASAGLLLNKNEKPWIHLKWLIPVIPDFALAILSRQDAIKHAGNQYAGLVIVPILFMGISAHRNWDSWAAKAKSWALAWVIGSAFILVVTNPFRVWKKFLIGPDSGIASRPFVQSLRDVPKSESIAVSEENLLPFTVQRENLTWMPKDRFSFETLNSVDWIAFKRESNPQGGELCLTDTKVEWEGYMLCRIRKH